MSLPKKVAEIMTKERHNPFIDGLFDPVMAQLIDLATGNEVAASQRLASSPHTPSGKRFVYVGDSLVPDSLPAATDFRERMYAFGASLAVPIELLLEMAIEAKERFTGKYERYVDDEYNMSLDF